jgi:hypothetical protein
LADTLEILYKFLQFLDVSVLDLAFRPSTDTAHDVILVVANFPSV